MGISDATIYETESIHCPACLTAWPGTTEYYAHYHDKHKADAIADAWKGGSPMAQMKNPKPKALKKWMKCDACGEVIYNVPTKGYTWYYKKGNKPLSEDNCPEGEWGHSWVSIISPQKYGKLIYAFTANPKGGKALLGGKGAGLSAMTKAGLPVPAGFTLTTNAYKHFQDNEWTTELDLETRKYITRLENKTGHKLGDPKKPLIVSVRSGAPESMPGMMETFLNVGLNDTTYMALAAQAGIEFATDSYIRLIRQFAKLCYDKELPALTKTIGQSPLGRVSEILNAYAKHTTRAFPQDPHAQITKAIKAVFRSAQTDLATQYAKDHGIENVLTACNVVQMVFGNMNEKSGTGVVFSRDPRTGENVPYGDFLPNAQGEDVVSGTADTLPIGQMEAWNSKLYWQLQAVLAKLEGMYHDMVDVEFTVENGKLYILQVRPGKRTPQAEWVIAHDLVTEGLKDPYEAAVLLDPNADLSVPRLLAGIGGQLIGRGIPASPGIGQGGVVTNKEAAQQAAKHKTDCILFREETVPDDYPGMVVSKAIMTLIGGRNSHAAVVARAESIPAVVSLKLTDDWTKETLVGKQVTVDGTNGEVWIGDVSLVDDIPERVLEAQAFFSDYLS